MDRNRKAYQNKILPTESCVKKECEVQQIKTTSSSEELQTENSIPTQQSIPSHANRSQSSKTLQYSFAQPQQQPSLFCEDKENVNTQNRGINNSRKLEELYNKNFNKVVRSGTSLLNIEERPSSVFPLRSPSHDQNTQNIFKKSNSTLEGNINNLDHLFDQIKLNEGEKQPCKIEMVKNLYQRTFSNEEGSVQKIQEMNDNKIREDNFYRGYLMNPYGTSNTNWQFSKNDGFNYGVDNCSKNNRVSSISINSASTTTEEDSHRSSQNLKYPDLSDVDHRKLMPVKKQSNDLIDFSPSEKINVTPGSKIHREPESYEQVMAQLFN
jgi:hypothetical protein